MELLIRQLKPGCADGEYRIKAKGAIAASLHWADETGILSDWSPLAYVPIGPNGTGSFRMTGSRGIPRNASHLTARVIGGDFGEIREMKVPVCQAEPQPASQSALRFLVMTDLHLSGKPWQVRKALSMGNNYDAVLIPGDLTNDGTAEQLELFWSCVEEVLPDKPVFAVAGNHDFPKHAREGSWNFALLQHRLLQRAQRLGVACHQDDSGAFAAVMGDTEIIGLNAASRWRHLEFPVNMQDKWSRYPFARNDQLRWLMFHLLESKAKRHIILCHGPLAEHRPYKAEEEPPYFSNDTVLQRIVDVQRTEVIFLSGHTHLSLNCRESCVEMAQRGHLYINAGSIRPTTLKEDEALQPECWTEGNVVALEMTETEITVTGISLKTGQKIARGYYCFPKKADPGSFGKQGDSL